MLYKSRFISVAMALPLALLALNCFQEPLSPIMPTWDTNITVPLANRTYTVAEIIAKDTTLLKTGTGNQISISKSVSINPTYVNDLLTLNPRDTSVQMQIGGFAVNADPQRTALVVDWLPQGATVPVPDTTIAFADVQDNIPTFDNIIVKSGTISLTIENKLPVAMEIQTPIRLLDRNSNTVATFTFNPSTIPARSTRTATDGLASKKVDADYTITNLRFHTPGSATPVQIPVGEMLVATIFTTNLKASSATLTDLPSQRLADNDTAKLRIDDSTMVRELYMRSGGLRFALTNNVPVGMWFKFRFTELQRRIGSNYVPYEDSVYLNANGSGSMQLNLTNARIRTGDGSLIKSLSVLSTVAIPARTGLPITISETDRVQIAVSKTSSIVVDSAVGVVKPTWVNVDTKIGLNLGAAGEKFTGQINIPSASLALSTISSIGFPADLYVKIGTRRSATGDSVFINIPASQRRVTPGQDVVHLDPAEVGRFLSQVAGKLPDTIRIYGRALVNPTDVYSPTPAGVGTVGSNSSIAGSVKVDLPLNLGLADGFVRDTLAIGDTTGDGTKDFTLDKDKTKYLTSGKVYIEIENGLPVSVSINLGLLDRSRNQLLAVPQSGSPLSYAAASVDGDGNVIAPAKSSQFIQLNQAEAEMYNPAQFASYAVRLNTTGAGQAVKFRTTDKVRIRVWSHLLTRVGK